MDYFLMAREGWGLTEERFIQLLTARWPFASAQPVQIPGGSRAVDFELEMAESTLQGHLNAESSAIVYYGALRDCAEFALWYQAAVPEACPLTMFDEGYSHHLELRPETTAEDIIRALSDSPDS